MIKCKTWEQKKVLDYIESQFDMEHIEVQIHDDTKLMVTDKNGDSLIFFYYRGEVITIDVE